MSQCPALVARGEEMRLIFDMQGIIQYNTYPLSLHGRRLRVMLVLQPWETAMAPHHQFSHWAVSVSGFEMVMARLR